MLERLRNNWDQFQPNVLVSFVLFSLLVLFLGNGNVESAPSSTLTIDPSATAGTTITAADENNRNNDVSTWANAHDHTDITQTGSPLNVGDGTAGDKDICANAADSTDSCFRWDDTNDQWVMQTFGLTSYSSVVVVTGTAGLTNEDLLIGGGISSAITASGINVHTTVPAVFGDLSARVRNSAAISLTSGTAAALTFNSERFDTDTIHSTSSNTERLTATTAGKYQVTGHVEFAAGATSNGHWRLELRLNGTTVIASQDGRFHDDIALTTRATITTYYEFAATDYVELRVTQTGRDTLNVTAAGNYSPEFEMVKVP